MLYTPTAKYIHGKTNSCLIRFPSVHPEQENFQKAVERRAQDQEVWKDPVPLVLHAGTSVWVRAPKSFLRVECNVPGWGVAFEVDDHIGPVFQVIDGVEWAILSVPTKWCWFPEIPENTEYNPYPLKKWVFSDVYDGGLKHQYCKVNLPNREGAAENPWTGASAICLYTGALEGVASKRIWVTEPLRCLKPPLRPERETETWVYTYLNPAYPEIVQVNEVCHYANEDEVPIRSSAFGRYGECLLSVPAEWVQYYEPIWD